jgi:hypothetical protein
MHVTGVPHGTIYYINRVRLLYVCRRTGYELHVWYPCLMVFFLLSTYLVAQLIRHIAASGFGEATQATITNRAIHLFIPGQSV